MSDEARLIFSAYRPKGQDADDPTFAAALEAAKHDPALTQWLAEQQAFDHAMAGHLRAVEIPADLRARILAGAALSRPRSRWTAPRVCAVLAGLAIIGGIYLALRVVR